MEETLRCARRLPLRAMAGLALVAQWHRCQFLWKEPFTSRNRVIRRRCAVCPDCSRRLATGQGGCV